jgi:RNA polymerase sigma-70 factor, ECF subfamily
VEGTIDRTVALSERDAFAGFVRPHWDVMAALARRLAPRDEAEDALQEALAAAWRKRAQFDAERGTARNWLLAIVADQAHKRRRGLRPTTELVDVAADGPDRDVDVDLRRALLALTPRQRTAIALHYYLGLPVADVAAVLACSAGTVKSTLSDARQRLRTLLGGDYR